MKFLFELTSSLVSRINALVAQSERMHPGMQEVAAMVYVAMSMPCASSRAASAPMAGGNTTTAATLPAASGCRKNAPVYSTGVSRLLPQSDHEPG